MNETTKQKLRELQEELELAYEAADVERMAELEAEIEKLNHVTII